MIIAIHYDATGVPIIPLVQAGQGVNGPVVGLLPGAVGQVTFDATTNPGVLAAIGNDWASHRVVAGVLQRRGVPVALAAPGPGAAEHQAVQAVAGAFLGGTDLTLAQLNQVIRWLVRHRLAQGG